jgi:hypothetical protein
MNGPECRLHQQWHAGRLHPAYTIRNLIVSNGWGNRVLAFVDRRVAEDRKHLLGVGSRQRLQRQAMRLNDFHGAAAILSYPMARIHGAKARPHSSRCAGVISRGQRQTAPLLN